MDCFLRREYRVAVLAGTDKAAAALRDDLIARHIPVSAGGRELDPGKVCVLTGSLSGGMELPELKFALITHGKAAAKTVRRKKSKKPGEQIRSLSDLAFGDYVVHAAHGIGVFEGVVKGLHQNPLCGNRHVVCPCDPTGSGKQIHRPQRG